MYRHQRHIYDASRKFYLLGRDGLIADLAPPEGGSVLEIGCGTGRNLVRIAQAYPSARCHGLDVSEAMLATASASIDRVGLSGRIRLAQADATDFDPNVLFGIEGFDRIVISYALSMIPPWQAVLASALGHLAPGGQLHIVDFGHQQGLPPFFRALLNRWLSLFHVTPRQNLEAEITAIAQARGVSVRCTHPFRGYAVRAQLTRPA
ncbi:class I SAM-dependent methyltransferase [Terrihabitans sp. B22-R8]|uniref:class I SAM-dependent methyltransferase n=1 Tax=Terrihabitans sp. B22-R8 TaxID=3425128 RepID=UPI00403CE743